MSSPLSKESAIALFGSQAKLAEALNISRAAVAQWGELVPDKQAMRIRFVLKPQAFKRDGSLRARMVCT